jgi:Tol biopolymer transport system component
LLVVVVAAGWFGLTFGAGDDPTSTHVVDLNGHDAHEVAAAESPSFTPDGRLLGGDANWNLITIAPPNGPRIATGDLGQEPAMSPNRRTVAYTRCWPDQFSAICGGISLVPANGGTGRPLTDFGDNPAWSPDGRWIVFATMPSSSDTWPSSHLSGIWVIHADGTGRHLLIKLSDPSDANPTFDPSGQWIAFSMNGDIYTINTSGNQLRQLTHTGHDVQPAWAPNGTVIAFIHACRGIWLVNPAGNRATRIPNTNRATDPTWAPTSTRLAYEINGPGAVQAACRG